MSKIFKNYPTIHIIAARDLQHDDLIQYFDATIEVNGTIHSYEIVEIDLVTFSVNCYTNLTDTEPVNSVRFISVVIEGTSEE